METVVFTSWKEGLKKISLTHLLNDRCGISLTQAKILVDALVKGVVVDVKCREAKALLKEAKNLGAVGEIRKSDLKYA